MQDTKALPFVQAFCFDGLAYSLRMAATDPDLAPGLAADPGKGRAFPPGGRLNPRPPLTGQNWIHAILMALG